MFLRLFQKIIRLLELKWVFNVYVGMILLLLLIFEGERSGPVFCLFQTINVVLCLIFMSERPGFNLVTSFYGFSLIVLGLFPIAEFKMNVIYWGGVSLSETAYVKTSLLILLSIVSFRFGYGLSLKSSDINVVAKLTPSIQRLQKKITIKTLLFLLVPCLYILKSFDYNIIAMQFRGMSEDLENVFVFEWFFVKPLIFNIFFFYFFLLKFSPNRNWMLKFLFFFGLIFFVNPMSLARFLAFALFVPLFYLLCNFRRNNTYLFINMVFFGLVFIFPILDIFRWFTLDSTFEGGQNFNFDYFFAGHFDAFQNFTRVIDLDIRMYGTQVMGAFLFFIPRAIWPTKPIGSGFILAEKAGLYFDNISMPFVAELYLDFSFVGVLIGMFLLGLAYRKLDNYMRRIDHLTSLSHLVKLIAFSEFCCLQFYLLRGNLMGAFAFSSSVLMTLFVVYFYFYFINNIRNKYFYGIKPRIKEPL
jgi:oligosaccharide repeat unit polymerase